MKCYESFRSQIDFQPEVALILGSGLGDFANDIRVTATLDYHDIEGFPVSLFRARGRFIFGYVGDVPVVCMQGRVHYYEGYPMTDVVLRPPHEADGAKHCLTRAAHQQAQARLSDAVKRPDRLLRSISAYRTEHRRARHRFPDMSQIYDLEFQKIARKAAASLDIDLMEGVYLQLTGPQYESPQEIAMCRTLGADAVGMSTACEAIAARHMGMRVIGISCITNLAAGISPQPLCHAEVQEAADMVAPQFKKLVAATIQGIAKTL